MPTPQDLRADFKNRFTAILRDLKDNGQKDPQVIWLIGSLADDIVRRTELATWPDVRAALSPHAFNDLLNQFRDQAEKMTKDGNHKAAYAIQAMATSLISRRFDDPEFAEGVALMDAFINEAVKFYKANGAAGPQPN